MQPMSGSVSVSEKRATQIVRSEARRDPKVFQLTYPHLVRQRGRRRSDVSESRTTQPGL
jgi:hypothetical protein